MIDIDFIRGYFPGTVGNVAAYSKHILKEYLQLMILDFLSSSPYGNRLTFIGGTSLRLVYGIDRFSEDLDFDCKGISKDEFTGMTEEVIEFLRQNDLNVETRDKVNPRLSAYRRNLYFPQLLFDMNLTGHRDERFLIKIEAQDQGVEYVPEIADIKRCGFFFPIQVPPKSILCSMKLAALLSRAKGRDFYDSMFLLSMTEPDYQFLRARTGVGSIGELKDAIKQMFSTVDMRKKSMDFEHLLFNVANGKKILRFGEFIQSL